MDKRKSEKLLADMNNIEMMLSARKIEIKLMEIIKQYLKIYLIDPVETDIFIEGYFKYGRLFHLDDILNRLMNRKNNMKLYYRYKEMK